MEMTDSREYADKLAEIAHELKIANMLKAIELTGSADDHSDLLKYIINEESQAIRASFKSWMSKVTTRK